MKVGSSSQNILHSENEVYCARCIKKRLKLLQFNEIKCVEKIKSFVYNILWTKVSQAQDICPVLLF